MFTGLSEEALETVAKTCVIKSFDKGNFIFRENEPADGFFVVQSGTVGIVRTTREGREQVICSFKAGESFAEVVLSEVPAYPASAQAFEATQVVLVRKELFRDLIFNRPELAMRMLGSMSLHLKHLVQLLEDLKFKQVESRLAHWLLRQIPALSRADGPPRIELASSKKMLASQLGVTSETLSRTLARFRDEGLISVTGKTITLLAPDGLAAYEAGNP